MRAKSIKLLRAIKERKRGTLVPVMPRTVAISEAMAKKLGIAMPDPPPKVVIPKGCIPRWVNDWPEDNFQKKIDKGYMIVLKDGLPVTRPSGARPDGSMGFQHLMAAPERLAAPDASQGSYMDGVREHLEALDLPVPEGLSTISTTSDGKVIDDRGKWFPPQRRDKELK